MLGFFLILAACALWAVDTLVRYPLMGKLNNSFAIVFYEHLLLTIILLVISVKSWSKIKAIKISHLFYFLMIGGVGSAFATMAFTQAFSILNPSLVILLQKFQPVVAIILASIVLKEKIQKVFILWASVCLVGALLISFEDILNIVNSASSLEELLLHQKAMQGYLLVMFSIVGWGAATVFGKKLVTLGYGDDVILAGRFTMGFLCLLPFAFSDKSLFTHSMETYGSISLMVLISGLLGMYLYYQGLRKISARLCSLAEMFFPLMAVIVNWLFLEAVLTPVQILGGIILILGSLVIQIKRY